LRCRGYVDEEEIRGYVSIWPLKLNAGAVAVALIEMDSTNTITPKGRRVSEKNVKLAHSKKFASKSAP